MTTEFQSRRPSLARVNTGIGNLKSSRNAHPAGQPKPENPKNINRTGFDLVFHTLGDKWRHREQSEKGLKMIFKLIIGELKNGKTAIEGVEKFLKDERTGEKTEENTGVDDCVRWYLLLYAIDPDSSETDKDDNEKKARSQLIEILIKSKPYLAFENIYNQEGPSKVYSQTCAERWHKDLKEKKTPLHLAVSHGTSSTVWAMIEQGRKFYDKKDGEYSLGELRAQQMNSKSPNFSVESCRFANIMNQEDLTSKDTPLKLAYKWRKFDTIHALLGVTDIASGDRTFKEALEDGEYLAVEAFLRRSEVARAIVTKDLVVEALGNLKIPTKNRQTSETQSEHARMEIAKLMVKSLDDPSKFDRKVAEKIIQSGRMDIWEAHNKEKLDDCLKEFLLHLAVKNQQYGFVQLFVRNYPSSVAKKWAYVEGAEGYYPLWYNNHNDKGFKIRGDSNSDRTKIRDEITDKMIQEESEMGILFDMFNSCEEPVSELCFDLSRFDSAGYQVSVFIDSMISQPQTQRLLKFEKTLRYAEFPPLDALKDDREAFKDSCYLQQEHNEVFRILEWLKDKMKVKTIIKLKVPDRLVNSHDEDKMANYVDQFKVQIFDWKALDLWLGALSPGSKQRITDLHLYSSGKRSVISHWFGPEGIQSMPKLEVLRINIIQETCTSTHLWNLKGDIESRLDKLESSCLKDTRVDQISWYPKAQQANLIKIAQRIDPKLGRWIESLNKFYQHGDFNNFIPTRVAILDGGVLNVNSTSSDMQPPTSGKSDQKSQEDNNSLSSRIKGGRSFVAGGASHSPWHLACNPHGTQMANLICAMDPLCDIYIARVAEDAVGITPERVFKAIEWAIDMGVDVISMSFTIGEKGSLAKALDKATAEGIVMTCSTHDEGPKTEEAWPASFKGEDKSLIVLAACDENGRTLRNIESKDYHFLIPGRNVSAGNIPFLKSEETISGSSVATALAAGICSLTLTCDRLANSGVRYAKGREKGSRYERVMDQLTSMKSKAGSQPVVLTKFGGIDTAGLGASGNPRPHEILNKFSRRWT